MSKILELRGLRADAIKRMRAVLNTAETEARELTDDETASYDSLESEVTKLDAAIAREEKLSALEESAAAPIPAVAAGGGTRAPPAVPAVKGPEASKEFENFGEFMYAVRFRPSDQRLEYQDFDTKGEQRMDDGTQGGFAVPEQFRAEIMQVDPQQAIIRPRAMVLPAGTPPDAAITIPALDQTGDVPDNVYGGISVQKTNEGASKPESEFGLRQIMLQPQEFSGYTEMTDKLIRNWAAASSMLQRQFRGAMMATEDREFLQGNGVGGPLGILNAGATYEVTRDTAGAIKYVDVANMLARILMRGGTPIWMASQSTMTQFLTMRNDLGDSPQQAGGELIFQPSAVPGMAGTLMGYPIIWHERSPQLGTAGDLVLADLQYYLIKDGSGPFVASSEHVKFRENKTAFKIFWNVDGQPWLTEPFKQEGGYQVSPFVSLGTA